MTKISHRYDSKSKPSESEIKSLLAQLEQQRNELQSRLPAHSISPSLIAELDELDDEIEKLKSELDSFSQGK